MALREKRGGCATAQGEVRSPARAVRGNEQSLLRTAK
jgi:hypothetical protein